MQGINYSNDNIDIGVKDFVQFEYYVKKKKTYINYTGIIEVVKNNFGFNVQFIRKKLKLFHFLWQLDTTPSDKMLSRINVFTFLSRIYIIKKKEKERNCCEYIRQQN